MQERLRAKEQQRRDSALALDVQLSKQPVLCVQQAAIARFFYDYVLDNPSGWRESSSNGGYLARVPDMYSRCSARSSFALALSAAANANFWRRHRSPQAQENSLKDCGLALQQMRQDLQHRSGAHHLADTLTASVLLAIYQLIVIRDVAQRTSWTAHVNGAVALLRSEEQAKQEPGKLVGVPQTITSQMLIDCLIMGRHPKLPMEQCLPSMTPPNSPATLLTYMYRAAELCASGTGVSSLWVDHTQQTCSIVSFLEKCQALDEEIAGWMHSREDIEDPTILPNIRENVPAPLRPLFLRAGAPKTVHLCADIHQTHIWNFYRACRLTILRAMMAAIKMASALTTDQASLVDYELMNDFVVSRTITLVDDVCSTIFSSLVVSIPGKTEPKSMSDIEGFRAFQMLWPSHAAGTCLRSMGQRCPGSAEKLDWVRSVFRCIRDEVGIQSANNFLQVNGG